MSRLPIGPAPTLLLILFLISGAWILLQPAHNLPGDEGQTVLHFWTFASTHYDAYKAAAPSFEQAHPGVKVDVQLVHARAVTSRLLAAFWADLDVPDLVEVDQLGGHVFPGAAGRHRIRGRDGPAP